MKSLKRFYHFNEIDSTSAYLLRRRSVLRNFSFCSADYQTSGKGRTGRKWQAASGENLLFSLLVSDKYLVNSFRLLSVASAVAVISACEKFGVKNLSVKWPNDVYADGKKVCGILLESVSADGEIAEIVIGIGINVNQTEFDGDFYREPTSLFLQTGKKINIRDFKKTVYKEITRTFKSIKKDDLSFLDKAKSADFLKGKTMFAEIDGEKKQVTVIGIEKDGLKVIVDGIEKTLFYGEVSFHV